MADSRRDRRVIVQPSGRAIPGPDRAEPLAFLGMLCWLFAITIGLLVVTGSEALRASDYRIGAWFDSVGLDDGLLGNLAVVWHFAGGPRGATLLTIIVAVVLLATKRRGWALYLIVCTVGGVIISEVLKHAVGRARPNWPDPRIIESGGSFPSGHSMSGIYCWSVIGLILMYVLRRPLGTVLGWIFIVFGLLLAPSRLILGVHWPSDTVAGWMLGLGWVLLVSAVAIAMVANRARSDPSAEAVAEVQTVSP